MSFTRALRVAVVTAVAAVVLGACIRFAPPEPVALSGTTVLADVTGDGTGDILNGGAAGNLRRYEYCGQNCLEPKEVFPGENLHLVGRFNADNADDVITVDSSFTYRLRFGSPTGLSATAVTLPPLNYTQNTGDFNGDGRADLLSVAFGGVFDPPRYTAQFGNGAGGFTTSSFSATGAPPNVGPTRVKIGDVDGDGRDDLITGSYGSVVVTRYSAPECGFGACPTFLAEINGINIAVGDIDGDGRADLAAENSSDTIDFFRSTGTGFTPFPPHQTISAPNPNSVLQLRDIDDDGIVDFLLNDGPNPRTWWSGTNDGGFPIAAATDVPLLATGCEQCFGDVDGDGRLDAVAPESATGTGVRLWFNISN